MSGSCKSWTPAELAAGLRELEIDRSLRTLESWREKGLLPPLRRVGRGRGPGALWVWNQDVIDQATAAHCLLTQYARTDAAILTLWVSGYAIRPADAKKAWTSCIERGLESVHREETRTKATLWQLGRRRAHPTSSGIELHVSARDYLIGLLLGPKQESDSDYAYWRRFAESIVDWYGLRDSKPFQRTIADFAGSYFEWEFGDRDRDDEGLRSHMAEVIAAFDEQARDAQGLPTTDLYATAEGFWEKVGYETFAALPSKHFVRSLRNAEVEATRHSLADIREIVAHGLALRDGTSGKVDQIRQQLTVMSGLGHLAARILISVGRQRPNWPLAETVSAIHAFVIGVKSEDLRKQKNNDALLSERVHEQWQTVKQDLAQLWKPILENSPKR